MDGLVEHMMLDLVRAGKVAKPARPAEAYGWEPARVGMCTCGETFKAPGLRAINAAVERHMEVACEGCDHAVWIDSTLLDDKERH